MGHLSLFFSGVAGAFVVYILMYRETRIYDFLKNPGENWMMLFVDFFLFLMAGGLVATFALTKPTAKDAFIAGISWQGVVGGLFSSLEYSNLKKDYSTLNTEFAKNLKVQEALRLRTSFVLGNEDDILQEIPDE